MKNRIFILSLGLFAAFQANAQDDEFNKESTEDLYNRWTIEAGLGQSKGVRPYTEGFYSSNANTVLGTVDLNSYQLGVRYMFTPKFGVRLRGSYDMFENNRDTDSEVFKTSQIRFDAEGVINMARVLNAEEAFGRFGLLLHGGLSYSRITADEDAPYHPIGGPSNYGFKEDNLGVVFGVTPQLRVTDRLAVYFDVTSVFNFRQHFAWDGHYSESKNNLQGHLINASLGLSYGFGQKQELHGDWGVIENRYLEEIEALDRRIGELETMLNDSDKDGVPDYIDVENNSIPGVEVDMKGRMVDLNQNGVPDQLERYVNESVKERVSSGIKESGSEVVKQMINDGYIAIFYDFDKVEPNEASTENLAFILTYLRNNPSASVEVTGYADEIGNSEYNNKLSERRAQAVKELLQKAGINASRISIAPKGVDSSVDKDSKLARRLVRKSTFTIK